VSKSAYLLPTASCPCAGSGSFIAPARAVWSALADDETLGGAGVARDGSAELDVVVSELTANEKNWYGLKLLDKARGGNAKAMLDLLDGGADVDFKDKWSGCTALLLAAALGHSNCVRLLLDAEAGTEFVDHNQNTALMIAACRGRVDCVRLLLAAGADQEARNREAHTPLLAAVRWGNAGCARLLVDNGVDKEATDSDGNTALILAALHNHLDSVRLLIDAGANMNARNLREDTALMLATQSGHVDCARLLVDAGADRKS
jgi:ankyrin repeat protein